MQPKIPEAAPHAIWAAGGSAAAAAAALGNGRRGEAAVGEGRLTAAGLHELGSIRRVQQVEGTQKAGRQMAGRQAVAQMLQGAGEGQHGAQAARNEDGQDGIAAVWALVADLFAENAPLWGGQAHHNAIQLGKDFHKGRRTGQQQHASRGWHQLMEAALIENIKERHGHIIIAQSVEKGEFWEWEYSYRWIEMCNLLEMHHCG